MYLILLKQHLVADSSDVHVVECMWVSTSALDCVETLVFKTASYISC